MGDYSELIICQDLNIKEALAKLNKADTDLILFVNDKDGRLIGSLTDGDIRRGLLKGLTTDHSIELFIQKNPRFLIKGQYSIQDIIELRDGQFKVIPILDDQRRIIKIINFRHTRSYLPIDGVIMAGGRGSRLKPLTNDVPKPLLKVGDKPIMEHNLDGLRKYGIDDFWFSVRYKGELIEQFFQDGSSKQINIHYIWEDKPLGTIGAVSQIENFKHDYVLITNSDLLTTLDYEDFFLYFIEHQADMVVATIPYVVDVPYAVMETEENLVTSFKEKPSFTYYSNAGIYLVKREVLKMIPPDTFYNSTDLMEQIIKDGLKLVSYPLRNYWLDIGKPEDYRKAQEDISHLDL